MMKTAAILSLTFSVASAQDLVPCPAIPEGGCSVCGEGLCVTEPDAIFSVPGFPNTSCGDLELAGLISAIPLDQCPFLAGFVGDCGCGTALPAPPSAPVMMMPVPAPVAPVPAPVLPVPAPKTNAPTGSFLPSLNPVSAESSLPSLVPSDSPSTNYVLPSLVPSDSPSMNIALPGEGDDDDDDTAAAAGDDDDDDTAAAAGDDDDDDDDAGDDDDDDAGDDDDDDAGDDDDDDAGDDDDDDAGDDDDDDAGSNDRDYAREVPSTEDVKKVSKGKKGMRRATRGRALRRARRNGGTRAGLHGRM